MSLAVRFGRLCLESVLVSLAAVPAAGVDVAVPPGGREGRVDITQTTVAEYHGNNDDLNKLNDYYADLRNRFDLHLLTAGFELAARLDAVTFVQPPPGAEPPYADSLVPEKLTARWRDRALQLTIGDFYASFGRGIVLNVRKEAGLGADTTLRGAKVAWREGAANVKALAGLVNPTNLDGFSEKPVSDPHDLITGVRLSWGPRPGLTLGSHAVGILFDPLERNDTDTRTPQRLLAAGLSAEVADWTAGSSLFAEADWVGTQHRQLELANGVLVEGRLSGIDSGYAAYAGADYSAGPWSIVGQAKLYQRLDIASWTSTDGGRAEPRRLLYNRAPTLEPEDAEVTNNHDVWGCQLAADYQPQPLGLRLSATVSGLVASDPLDAGERMVYHVRSKAEQDFNAGGYLSLTLGARAERPEHRNASSESRLYLRAAAIVPLAPRHSIEVRGLHRWSTLREPAAQSRFVKGQWSVSYGFSPLLDATVSFAYDTSPSQRRRITLFYRARGVKLRQVFFSGGVTVKPWRDHLHIRALLGNTAGGPACVDGYCRYLPAFSGARLETTLRF
jgi:hypothetical protein